MYGTQKMDDRGLQFSFSATRTGALDKPGSLTGDPQPLGLGW